MRPTAPQLALCLGLFAYGLGCRQGLSPARLEELWRQRAEPARQRGIQWRAALPTCAASPAPAGSQRVEGVLHRGMETCTQLSCREARCCNTCRGPLLLLSEGAPRRGEVLLLPREGPLRDLYLGSDGMDCEISAWMAGVEARMLRLRMTWREDVDAEGRRRSELLELCRLEGAQLPPAATNDEEPRPTR